MPRRHLVAIALIASALLLTACGGGSNTAATAKGNDADIAFLTGMTPHHEQAVEMSEIILATKPSAPIAAIASKIKGAQAPEIEQMKTMLVALGEEADSEVHKGGHSADMAGHGGMMSDAEMAALMKATGTDAARLYLEGMVKHHQGAVEASNTEIADGQYQPAVDLAKRIKTAQQAEIAEMKALLKAL